MSGSGVHIYIDGAARGNPGPAAFGYVFRRDGQLLFEGAGGLGTATNNCAEYSALVQALEQAAELGERCLLVHSDSELLVKQMNGQYKVKNPDLKVLYQEAKSLTSRFDSLVIRHIARELNSHADRLCNEVLDGTWKGPSKAVRPTPAKQPSHSKKPDAVRQQILDCLRTAAKAWSNGDPGHPSVEAVGDQLWDILLANGLVRSATEE